MLKIKPQEILLFILYTVLFNGILVNTFHFPGVFIYITDILLIFLTVYTVIQRKRLGVEEGKIRNIIVIYMVIVMVAYINNYQNLFFFLGGFRNVFRYFVYFLLCTIYFSENNIFSFFRHLYLIFYLNAFVMLIQYFAFGLKQDYLGGIFGTQQGCNGSLNIFFVVIVSYSVLAYMCKKKKLHSLIFECGLALGLSGIAELKYFFIEFIIIIIFAFLTTDFSVRKLSLLVFSILGIILGISLIDRLFGMGYVFNIEFIITNSTRSGYTGTGDLNRGAFIQAIEQMFLLTTGQKLFGLGLGNCEAKTIFSNGTPFYERYGRLHYDWFASMHTFLEQGWAGLIFYTIFFGIILYYSYRFIRNYNCDVFYSKLTCLYSVLFFLVFFYNQTLRQDIAYLVMFCLAIPFVIKKRNKPKKVQL